MKVELSEELYLDLLKSANERGKTVEKHISGMQELYNNNVRAYEDVTQEQLDHFKRCLHFTIDELMVSQQDMANSDEGTEIDRKMVDVLNVLFGRATNDYMIVTELLKIFYDKIELKN